MLPLKYMHALDVAATLNFAIMKQNSGISFKDTTFIFFHLQCGQEVTLFCTCFLCPVVQVSLWGILHVLLERFCLKIR